jgi:site-specific DNA-methyltransferase (adenine-specific)
MEYMAGLPDKAVDLAIVDPEFGIDIGNSGRLVTDKGLPGKNWDKVPPKAEYFAEVMRVTKMQIIWGGNYFWLPPTRHPIIWDKRQPEDFSFGMFDFAWTSFDGPAKIFRYKVHTEKNKIHPTQKPVALYKWLLTNYAKPGDKILDTHIGSGSSRIAAWDMGFDFYGTELDPDYFAAMEKRFKDHISKPVLFAPGEMYQYEQTKLFD